MHICHLLTLSVLQFVPPPSPPPFFLLVIFRFVFSLFVPSLVEVTMNMQGCIFRLTCSHPELTKDHVLTSAYVEIFRTVTRNAVNKSVGRKKYCS